jgi:hypothetical protein
MVIRTLGSSMISTRLVGKNIDVVITLTAVSCPHNLGVSTLILWDNLICIFLLGKEILIGIIYRFVIWYLCHMAAFIKVQYRIIQEGRV